MKFSIGQLVVEKKSIHPRTSYQVLKVAGTLNGALLLESYGGAYDGEVHVDDWTDEPGSRSWRSALERHQEEDLFTLEEALEEQRRLEAAKNKLDGEFEQVRSQIQDSLDKAAVFVQEAGGLAKSFGREFHQMKKECMSLYRALDEGGWSHSHMSC
jgi:hypothetical protein